MTLERFFAILLKQWKLVVASFILVGLGAYIGSRLTTPIYQSTVLIQVAVHSGNSSSSDINGLLASDQLVQTESQLATSDLVLQEVVLHYQGLTFDKLKAVVSSTFKLNTQVFQIDVQDPNPEHAAVIANDVANTFIKQQLQLTQQDNARSRQQVQTELSNTQQQIQAITTQISQLQAQADAASIQQQQGDQQAQRLNQAPPNDAQIVKQIAGWHTQINVLQTKLNNLQQQYSQWQTALAQFDLTTVQNSDFVRIVQPAQAASKPVLPNAFINTLAGLTTGLLLGVLLAILIEQLDTRIRTPETLATLLNRPVLATIWYKKTRDRQSLLNLNGKDANVEAYRILHTNIEFSDLDKPVQSLLITSAVAEEGKSVVAANLALVMAKAGKNTLLIDADLHHPTQHALFNISPNKMGLSNAVLALKTPQKTHAPTNHQFLNRVTQLPETRPTPSIVLENFLYSGGVPNLWVMPAGIVPPNPSDLIISKSMQRLLTMIVNSNVDVIIIDAPPLLGLSDVGVLAPRVDGTLIVTDILHTTKNNIKQLKSQLVHANIHVLGCVVNKQLARKKDAVYPYDNKATASKEDKRSSRKMPLLSNTPPSSIPSLLFPSHIVQAKNGQIQHVPGTLSTSIFSFPSPQKHQQKEEEAIIWRRK